MVLLPAELLSDSFLCCVNSNHVGRMSMAPARLLPTALRQTLINQDQWHKRARENNTDLMVTRGLRDERSAVPRDHLY
jgi:hypothetical protein